MEKTQVLKTFRVYKDKNEQDRKLEILEKTDLVVLFAGRYAQVMKFRGEDGFIYHLPENAWDYNKGYNLGVPYQDVQEEA